MTFCVDDLLAEHFAKHVRRENVSTPIFVQCNDMYQALGVVHWAMIHPLIHMGSDYSYCIASGVTGIRFWLNCKNTEKMKACLDTILMLMPLGGLFFFENVTNQSNSHSLTQSFGHSLVSHKKQLEVIRSHQHVPFRADLNQEPVQEEGICLDSNLRAQPLRLAPSLGRAKLGNDLCYEFESMVTKKFKVCRQNSHKQQTISESQTCIDWASFDFKLLSFPGFPLKIITHSIC